MTRGNPMNESPDRRRFLLGLGALATYALAGCGSSEPDAGSRADLATTRPGSSGVPAPGMTAPPATAPATTAIPEPTEVPAQPPGCPSESSVLALPLRARLGQLLMCSIATTDPAVVRSLAATTGVGGVYVDTPSVAILRSVRLCEITTDHGIPLLVSIDEEGGRVQRTTSIGLPKLPSAQQLARTRSADQVLALAREHGSRLRELGITCDFAPVIDVSGASAAIGDRSFSDDLGTVTAYGRAFAEGLWQAGVLPTYKHFPGHGRGAGDSHVEVTTTPSLGQLRDVDLVPFRELLAGPTPAQVAVMIGHLDVPGLTAPGEPTSISPRTIGGLLRGVMGFDGLVFTDELGGMKAVSSRIGLPEAARRSIAAGADMPIWLGPQRVPEVLDHLVRAVDQGTLAEADVNRSCLRVLRVKHAVGTPAPC